MPSQSNPQFANGDRVLILDCGADSRGRVTGNLGDLISVTRPNGDRTLHPASQLEHLD
jgi:hypothetical protein